MQVIQFLSKESEEAILVKQFHFTAWPDKDIPDNAWCILEFWRAVNMDLFTAPIVVHCRYIVC